MLYSAPRVPRVLQVWGRSLSAGRGTWSRLCPLPPPTPHGSQLERASSGCQATTGHFKGEERRGAQLRARPLRALPRDGLASPLEWRWPLGL